MKRILALAGAFAFLLASAARAETFSLDAFVTARATHASGPPSWLERGFGRFDASDNSGLARAQVGLDWQPSPHFDLHADGIARADSPDGGRRAGLVQAYAEGRIYSSSDQLQLRVGQFFLPTSRENTGPLWTAPYMLSFSALNSWIGNEVRPVGADLEWKHFFGESSLTAAMTAFRDNDTAGTMLAWRGWTVGDRLTVFNEVLPLPPISPLFTKQRSDGTLPFENDLDGRTGYSWRVRWNSPDLFTAMATHVDNHGDRNLYRGEYAWATSFTTLGVDAGSPQSTLVASEYVSGKTGMGSAPVFVQADFYAAYLLLSHTAGRNRFSARYDVFGVLDRDGSSAGDNTQHGNALAVAWLYSFTPHVRGGLEVANVRSRNAAAMEAGFGERTGGTSVAVEIRYSLR